MQVGEFEAIAPSALLAANKDVWTILVAAALTGVEFARNAALSCAGDKSYRVDFLATQLGALVQSTDSSHTTFRLVIPRMRLESLLSPRFIALKDLRMAVANYPRVPLFSSLTSGVSKGSELERSVLFSTALHLWLAVNDRQEPASIGSALPEVVDTTAASISAVRPWDEVSRHPIAELHSHLGRHKPSGAIRL